jgi:hypothetical protein
MKKLLMAVVLVALTGAATFAQTPVNQGAAAKQSTHVMPAKKHQKSSKKSSKMHTKHHKGNEKQSSKASTSH